MKLRAVFFMATVLLGNVVAQEYEKILVDIRNAFDANKHRALHDKYLNEFTKRPNKYNAFGYATLRWQWDLMRKLGGFPNGGPNEGYAFKYAIREEKKSGYPLAMYSWYISRYRESNLPPLPEKIMKYIDIKDSKGRIVERNVPVYDHTGKDYALEKRRKDYISKALKIDPKNPLALYFSYGFPLEDNELDATATARMGSLLDIAKGSMWEIQLLSGLNSYRKKGNRGVPKNLDSYLNEARRKSSDGAFATTYGFLKAKKI